MRPLTLALAACLSASPAFAKPAFTVKQCEKQATDTDSAVQAFLKRSSPDAAAKADTAKQVNGFDAACIKPYMCSQFEPWWGEERETLDDLQNFQGQPDWFAKLFQELKTTCKKK